MTVLLAGSQLNRTFRSPRRRFFQPHTSVQAVRDVSIEVFAGESLALVGESGSGKSTLLRLLLGLDTANSGTVQFEGREVIANPRDRMLWLRRETGFVFQDPFTSMNPRMQVGAIIAEPLEALSIEGDHSAMVREMLDRVQLPADSAERYPHEFSGGQRQRIALARAIIHTPKLLVGDEPVSALDVLVRAHILELLAELKRELNLTLLTVTHDLGVVQAMANRVAVMRAGEIVEQGTTADVLRAPQHDYTRQLIASVPRMPGL